MDSVITMYRVEHAGNNRGAGQTSAGSNDSQTAKNIGCGIVKLAKEELISGIYLSVQRVSLIFY